MNRDRIRVLTASAATGLVAFALAAPAGHAAVTTFGSDLAKEANKVEDHGADSAFWNISIDGSSSAGVVPADGQITLARVKGIVLADPSGAKKPDPQFHLQVLHPVGGGQVRVALSSAPFRLPVGGDPQVVNSYRPVNLCVQRGDYVDFNDIGGFEWRWGGYAGMPVQVFNGAAAGSATAFYTKSDGTNVGTQWAPQSVFQREELLMRTTLATGPDATDICPGGYMQHVFRGVSIPRQSATLRTSTGIAKVKVLCPGPSYGHCQGVLVLKATLNGGEVTLGGAAFKVRPAYTQKIDINLSPDDVKLIQDAKGVTAVATADAKDDPRSDSRANSGVPVQSKSTRGRVTVKPDRLTAKKKKRKKRRRRRRHHHR